MKIVAIKNVFLRVWPKAKFKSVKLNSIVSDQPIGDQETIKGAIYRARTAMKATASNAAGRADFGVGIEGGGKKIDDQWYTLAWCAIVNKKRQISLGGGAIMPLPVIVGERLERGKELGPIMDSLTGRNNVKKQKGAIGVFTKGLVSRIQAYEQLVAFALVKFLSPKIYTAPKKTPDF